MQTTLPNKVGAFNHQEKDPVSIPAATLPLCFKNMIPADAELTNADPWDGAA